MMVRRRSKQARLLVNDDYSVSEMLAVYKVYNRHPQCTRQNKMRQVHCILITLSSFFDDHPRFLPR